MKTKIFAISGGYFRGISKTASYLEREINAWINANPGIKIIDYKAIIMWRKRRTKQNFYFYMV